MYLHRIPRWIVRNGHPFWWYLPGQPQVISLTFDDGPHPEITPWVLDQLDAFGVRATFFFIGDNVQKYPSVAREVVRRGHEVGNHTFHHVRGTVTPLQDYLNEVQQCQLALEDALSMSPRLFRPPYGRMTRAQVRALRPAYELVMMDVISGDFNPRHSPESCAQLTIESVKPGGIVLFHDSEKAWPRMQVALPAVLAHCREKLLPGVSVSDYLMRG